MAMLALAIDLGGTHATCGLVRDGVVLGRERAGSEGCSELAPSLPLFAGALRRIVSTAGVSLADCSGVAVGFCGLVDTDRSRVLSTNKKYEDAPGIDFAAWSQREFGLPLRMENDARMAMLGEWSAGAARGYGDIVMVTLGTGIGGVVMMGGVPVRGKHYQGGCLGGHLPMNARGRRCTCGAIGCAESEASTWALPGIAREWPGFPASLLAREAAIDFAALFRAADAGDAVANQILDHCIDIWSAMTVGLIHAYDPEIVVFGGGVMHREERILPPIRRYVEECAWTPWGKVRIARAECGQDAALLGAVPLLQGTTT